MTFDTRITEQQRQTWDLIASYWDARHTGPDEISPVEDVRPGEVVLDVGCGGGHHARLYTQAGATVVATDASAAFVDIARRNCTGLDIDFRVVDATDREALLALGEGRFDLVTAHMVLINLPDTQPLMDAVAKLLAHRGRFVFTVTHPCFPAVLLPDAGRDGTRAGATVRAHGLATRVQPYVPAGLVRLAARLAIGLTSAFRPFPYMRPMARRIADAGQPVAHVNFHRPLHLLLEPAFRAGLVVDGLRELSDPRRPDQAGFLELRLRVG